MRDYKPILGKLARDAAGRQWFYDHKRQCIGNMESDLSDVKIVMQLEEEQIRQCGSALNSLIRDNILYIAFQGKPELLEYNITNHTYRLYKNNLADSKLSQQYISVFYEDAVIFIPTDISQKGYVFDLNMRHYTIAGGEMHTGNAYNMIQNDGKIFLPVYGTNKIFVMDLDKQNGEVVTLDDGIAAYAICGTKEDLWICQSNKKVIVNLRNGKASYFILTDEDNALTNPFSNLVRYKDKVIVLPRFDIHIYVIELNNKVIKEITLQCDKEDFEKKRCSLTYGYHIYDDTLYLLPWGLDEIVELQLSDYKMTKRKLQITEEDYLKFFYQPPSREIEKDDLHNYMKWIQKR